MKKLFTNLGKGDIRAWIGFVFILLSFGFLFLLCFHAVPKENESIINIVAGAVLVGGTGAVISFYFGSSKTDHNKTNSNEPNI